MPTFKSFEEIEAWKIGRELAVLIYQVTNKGEFAKDYGLRDQVRRCAVSIPSNIAEGFERDGNKEFRQFLYHSKGSVGELQTQLYIASDIGYLNHGEMATLKGKADTIGRMLGGLLHYLAACELKGIKYRDESGGVPDPRNKKPATRNNQ
jgi:four helix bundle protein